MAKITIDDKEYETENFNEQQVGAYNELQGLAGEIGRTEYLLSVLKARQSFLAGAIVSLADAEEATEE